MAKVPRVILASASPRRLELLSQIVPSFEVLPSDVDEDALQLNDPRETAIRIAEAKARRVATQAPDAVVVAGDTVVAYEGTPGAYVQLAKPVDAEDARRMLRALSNREHVVTTGIALAHGNEFESFAETSTVRFRRLSEAEISAYVATAEPMDKAGAYAIQGGAKGFVDSLSGSWSNVVGLPIEALRPRLARLLARIPLGN